MSQQLFFGCSYPKCVLKEDRSTARGEEKKKKTTKKINAKVEDNIPEEGWYLGGMVAAYFWTCRSLAT